MGLSNATAKITAQQFLKSYPDDDLFSLVTKVHSIEYNTPKQPKKAKVTKLVPRYVEKDLRVIGDSEDAYESFRKAGGDFGCGTLFKLTSFICLF